MFIRTILSTAFLEPLGAPAGSSRQPKRHSFRWSSLWLRFPLTIYLFGFAGRTSSRLTNVLGGIRRTIRTISATSSGHQATNIDDVPSARGSESEQSFTAATEDAGKFRDGTEHADPGADSQHVEPTEVSADEPEKLANLFMIPYIGSFALDFTAVFRR